MIPVAASAENRACPVRSGKKRQKKSHEPRFCDAESLSAGRARSFTPAATRHHFMRGAQKKTVLGPAQHRVGCPGVSSGGSGAKTSLEGRTSWVVHERLEFRC